MGSTEVPTRPASVPSPVVIVIGDIDRWLRRFHRPSAAGPRLVCFPHAGGASTFFHPLSAALSDVAEVSGVQYPGRQDRLGEPALTSIDALADRIAEVLAPVTDRPWAFFGHSMGSIVAFEVIRRLEATPGARAPSVLFASGRPAPSRGRPGTVHLGDDATILDTIADLGGTDRRILAEPDLVELILPATRADYQAIETYRCFPDAMVGADVRVTIGDVDSAVTEAEALAWREHTTGAFDLWVLPGGHFYLTAQIDAVADRIRSGLLAAAR